jgi:hypothetical protein
VKKKKKKKKTGAGRDEQLELRSDGAQAHQCDALLRRELHKSSGAQPNHRVSIPHSPTASLIFLFVCVCVFFFQISFSLLGVGLWLVVYGQSILPAFSFWIVRITISGEPGAERNSLSEERVTGQEILDLRSLFRKCTRIEIHLLTPAGLQPMLDVPIYGRIATLELFRPPGESQDVLFLSLERYKFCVLQWDAETSSLVTRAMGDVSDKIGRPTDNGQIGIIDPDCRLIGLHLYDGLFKVIPIDSKGQLKEAFNIRLEELQVLDIKFLYGCSKPTIAVLYQDNKDARHVKTYEVQLKEKDFGEGPWLQNNLDNGAGLLIPVPLPLGGAIIIGEQTIVYYNGSVFKAIPIRPVQSSFSSSLFPSFIISLLAADKTCILSMTF